MGKTWRIGVVILIVLCSVLSFSPAFAGLKNITDIPPQYPYETVYCEKCGAPLTGLEGEQSPLAEALGLTLCIDCWLDTFYGSSTSMPLPDIALLGEDGKVLPEQLPSGQGGMEVHGNEYHDPDYEVADPDIQTHITSAHAPSDAQKNSDITKTEIEAKLTGEISSHTHAGGSGGGLVVSGATVYSGSSPTSWTDLDLSGIIGVNSAMVILSISATADMNAIAVRMNGDTAEYYHVSNDANAYGVALAHHDSTSDLVLICVADSLGRIEWITETSKSATIRLIAYIK